MRCTLGGMLCLWIGFAVVLVIYCRNFWLYRTRNRPFPVPHPSNVGVLHRQTCKVNFDSAVFWSSNSASLGVVMRDSSGAVIGALSVPTFLGSSVVELEALACLRAMQFALEIGLTRVIFKGDSATVINALRQGLGELTCYGNVLDDIRAHISDFQFCDFNLVS